MDSKSYVSFPLTFHQVIPNFKECGESIVLPYSRKKVRLEIMLNGINEQLTKSRTRLSDFTFMHWRRKRQPIPVFLPGESQGWGSLVGCYLWGRTELDTTEATQQQQQQLYIKLHHQQYKQTYYIISVLHRNALTESQLNIIFQDSIKKCPLECFFIF